MHISDYLPIPLLALIHLLHLLVIHLLFILLLILSSHLLVILLFLCSSLLVFFHKSWSTGEPKYTMVSLLRRWIALLFPCWKRKKQGSKKIECWFCSHGLLLSVGLKWISPQAFRCQTELLASRATPYHTLMEKAPGREHRMGRTFSPFRSVFD